MKKPQKIKKVCSVCGAAPRRGHLLAVVGERVLCFSCAMSRSVGGRISRRARQRQRVAYRRQLAFAAKRRSAVRAFRSRQEGGFLPFIWSLIY